MIIFFIEIGVLIYFYINYCTSIVFYVKREIRFVTCCFKHGLTCFECVLIHV